MNITIRGTLHGTDDYKSKCTSTTCEVCLDFLGSDVLLLTTETFQVKVLMVVLALQTIYHSWALFNSEIPFAPLHRHILCNGQT